MSPRGARVRGRRRCRCLRRTKRDDVINEAFAGTGGHIGFRSRTSFDESPETLIKTRVAVARAKQGDREALRYLYVSYSHNIYGYVRSIVRDDHEAEDVTQHVFAKLMTALGKYDERGVPFSRGCCASRATSRSITSGRIGCSRPRPYSTPMRPT